MPRTPGWPTHGPACVERVRNDGHWITGDPQDTDYRPWMNGGTRVLGNPMLLLKRTVFDIPVPTIPGWKTPRFGHGSPGILYMTYYPTTPVDPEAPAEQLTLF